MNKNILLQYVNTISVNLYDNLLEAKKFIDLEPDIALFKIRKCLEILVDYLLEKNNVHSEKNKTLYQKLLFIQEKSFINEDVAGKMHEIRKKSNVAIHDMKDKVQNARGSLHLLEEVIGNFYKDENSNANISIQDILDLIPGKILTATDKRIIDRELYCLETVVNHVIYQTRKFSVVNKYGKMSFREYYAFFIRTLKFLKNYDNKKINLRNSDITNLILDLRAKMEVVLATDNRMEINKYIASILYGRSSWHN